MDGGCCQPYWFVCLPTVLAPLPSPRDMYMYIYICVCIQARTHVHSSSSDSSRSSQQRSRNVGDSAYIPSSRTGPRETNTARSPAPARPFRQRPRRSVSRLGRRWRRCSLLEASWWWWWWWARGARRCGGAWRFGRRLRGGGGRWASGLGCGGSVFGGSGVGGGG